MVSGNTKTEIFSGQVRSVRAIRRNVVDLSLDRHDAAIRLSLDDDWFINKGDRVALAATRQDNGVWMSHAYRNFTKGVGGGLQQAFFSFHSVIVSLLAVMLWYFTWQGLTGGSGATVLLTFVLAMLFTYVGGNLGIGCFRTTRLASRQISDLNTHIRQVNQQS